MQRNLIRSAALAGAAALALTAGPVAAHPPMHGCGMGMGKGMERGAGMRGKAPTINVQGEGRASVAPDLATVSLGVTTQAPTAAQAMSDNATRQAAVIDALKAQGVAPADLQTQGLSLSPMQDFSREGQPPVITGYQAQNIVTARVRDLDRLGPLLDAMVAAGATDVQGISFSREDSAGTEDRARTAAVAEARRRAEVIARAAGMALGPLVSLTDTSFSGGPRPMAMMARAADAAESTPVEQGELTLTAQVTGVWSLRPAGTEGMDCAGPRGPHGQGDQGPRMRHEQENPRGDRGRRGMAPAGDNGGNARGPGGQDDPQGRGPGWQLAPAAEPVSPSAPPRPADGTAGPTGMPAGGSAEPSNVPPPGVPGAPSGPSATRTPDASGATAPAAPEAPAGPAPTN